MVVVVIRAMLRSRIKARSGRYLNHRDRPFNSDFASASNSIKFIVLYIASPFHVFGHDFSEVILGKLIGGCYPGVLIPSLFLLGPKANFLGTSLLFPWCSLAIAVFDFSKEHWREHGRAAREQRVAERCSIGESTMATARPYLLSSFRRTLSTAIA